MTGQTSLFPPEPAPDPLLCWLWLSQVLGPASLHAGKVLDAFGGAQEAWEARETEEFRQAAGDTAFKRAAQLDAESFHTLVMQCDALRVRILPFDDPDYPLAFSRIPDMPLVLYCTGDPRWLNEPGAVGIVGSRKPTEYGLNAAADIGGELAKNGAVIVSGLADGLDSAGHRAAVKNDCPTIAVMGVPIDRTYPAANAALRQKIEQKGCVISEYPPYSEYIGPTCFLQRNRLIAALSTAVLVVEAREKSGTMSTVAHAERYGKPVYAVLIGLNEQTATLQIAGQRHHVRRVTLGQWWRGDFATYWRAPPAYNPELQIASQGPAIRYLASQLSLLDGLPAPEASPAPPRLDEALRTRVRDFQRAHGLVPDGQPGPLTFMQLDSATGVAAPRLQTD